VPHVQSREFDEFDNYVGSSPDDLDDGLHVFSGSGVCPDITVHGVPLQYNECHDEVMVKTAHLGRILNNFGQDLPAGVVIPDAQHLQALTAQSFRDAKAQFSPYWSAYDARM
jgi:hypothetical protein